MENQELLYLLALNLVPQIGFNISRKLLSFAGSAKALFELNRRQLLGISGIGPILADNILKNDYVSLAKKELDYCKQNRIQCLPITSKLYPRRLLNCNDSPLVLFYRGSLLSDECKFLSIVGTRNATSYGLGITRDIVRELSEIRDDIVIVSGLAYGIDIAAHKAALDYSLKTYAILAHGLNKLYPPQHREYASQITENGAVITDFSTFDSFEKGNFPRRNRIIAGISDATLVIESTQKGGALVTADIAFSYDRDVLSVPGRSNDRFSSGCNALIKNQKATLVENAIDIIKYLGWEPAKKSKVNTQKELPEGTEREILDIYSNGEVYSIDEISRLLKKPVKIISPLFFNLEMADFIVSLPGKKYKIKSF